MKERARTAANEELLEYLMKVQQNMNKIQKYIREISQTVKTTDSFQSGHWKNLAITVPMDRPEDYAPSGSGYYFGGIPMALTILY